MNEITRTFRIELHEEYGTLGARPIDMPHADPIGAMGAAHDMLEHFPGDDGGIEAELMALGAAYWLRGETGYMQRNGSLNKPESHLAADFLELFMHFVGGFTVVDAPAHEDVPEHVAAALREVLVLAFELIEEEEYPQGERNTKMYERFKERRLAMLDYLCIGYTKVRERFADCDPYTLAHEGFENLEKAFDSITCEENEGLDVKVTINLDSFEVVTEEQWEDIDDE